MRSLICLVFGHDGKPDPSDLLRIDLLCKRCGRKGRWFRSPWGVSSYVWDPIVEIERLTS